MEYLRRRFASLLPRKHPSELIKEKEESMPKLIARYHDTEDAEEKERVLDKIYAQFPRTPFSRTGLSSCIRPRAPSACMRKTSPSC